MCPHGSWHGRADLLLSVACMRKDLRQRVAHMTLPCDNQCAAVQLHHAPVALNIKGKPGNTQAHQQAKPQTTPTIAACFFHSRHCTITPEIHLSTHHISRRPPAASLLMCFEQHLVRQWLKFVLSCAKPLWKTSPHDGSPAATKQGPIHSHTSRHIHRTSVLTSDNHRTKSNASRTICGRR